MGILDISGDQRSGHPHTLGLVNMAARMIENRLLTASTRRQTRLHLHARLEGIGSVAEGIVVLSDDGWIVGANSHAMAMLGLRAIDLNSRRVGDMIAMPYEQLLVRQHRRPGQPLQVHLHDGTALYAVVHMPHSTELTSAPVPTSNSLDALSRLDTGDARWRSAAEKVVKCWLSRLPCWCKASRVWVKSCLPALRTTAARATANPLSPSIARQCLRT
jgi:transcriptional regulator of acetoin/glycerol metabolism